MSHLVQSKDWSKTPLGPIEQWPQSLRTTVSLCLASNFPISIAWGPDRVQIYNDGYWPICGEKHPHSMGQDYKECWLSAWPVIGKAFEEASGGQTRFLENQRMFLDRYGYLEETFFTFSFSPILDESSGVGGLFHPVTELTQQSLAERRLDILRTIADRTSEARTVEQAFSSFIENIKDFDLDLPFVLLYTLNEDGSKAIISKNYRPKGDLLRVAEIDLEASTEYSQSLKEAFKNGQTTRLENLENVFGTFSCGPYQEAPHTAMMLPIVVPGIDHSYCVMVAGVSSRRELDDPYKLFYDLLKAALGNALTKSKAFEEERKRAEALAELDRAKTTFFSNISHEFRTPLTLMLGPLEETLNDKTHPLKKEQVERLELVQRNTRRLQKLVNSLLDFSRIEAGRLKAKYYPTDISSFTRELASFFQSAMEKAGLSYIINCETISEYVYLDHDMWEKIIFNLLSNALKFTFNGKVEIHLIQEYRNAVLKVTDTGEGIAKEELPNIFKRFYRIEGAKSRTHEGSGIGLAFVLELVKLHGGTIQVESEIGKGTTFTVTIPLGSAHLPSEYVAEDEKQWVQKTSTSNVFVEESMQWLLKKNPQSDIEQSLKENIKDEIEKKAARILVVDDNSDMLQYICRILGKNRNWLILSAVDGLDALESVKINPPDLILTDIMMPRMDGFQLLRELRSNSKTSRIPVIFFSARAGEEATIEGLEKGADDYLTKPFTAKELVARVKTNLELNNARVKEAAEALKRSEERYSTLFESIEDGFCILEKVTSENQRAFDFRFIEANPSFIEQSFAGHVIGKTIREVFPAESEELIESYNRVLETGIPFRFDRELISQKKVIESYVFRIEDPSHSRVGLITKDITARKKAEIVLLENDHRYRTLIEEATVATALYYGSELRVQYANDIMLSYWGKDKSVIGKPFREALPELEGQPFFGYFEKVYATGEPYVGVEEKADIEIGGKLQSFYFNFTYKPLRDNDGKIYGIHHMAIDVTEEVLSKRLLKSKNDLLIKINNDLDSFIYTASHDLKAPISNLEGLLNSLTTEELTQKERQELLDMMYHSIERFKKTIKDLTEISKVQRSDLNDLEFLKFMDILEEVELDIRELLLKSNPLISTKFDVEIINFSRKNLRSIIYNLLSNSLKYSSPVRRLEIQISTFKEGDFIQLHISDNGLGISNESQNKVFEMFKRAHQHVEGSGIGLYIIKRMVENAGGKIEMESEEGKGTTFKVYFKVIN